MDSILRPAVHRLSVRSGFAGQALLIVVLVLVSAGGTFAHDTMASSTIVRFADDTVSLQTKILAETAWSLAEDVGGYSTFQPNEFDDVRPAWAKAARQFFEVTSAGERKDAETSRVDLVGDYLILHVVYPAVRDAPLRLRAVYLNRMAPECHVSVVAFDEAGRQLGAKILQGDDSVLEIAAPNTPRAGVGPRPSFAEYVRLGVHHILSGYDHLLFLGALLVACQRFTSMLAIVTCFTAAHSITLALAAMDLVVISNRIIEPLISATIIFVAVENLVRRDEPRGRWAITLGFGLVHGFGFASVLKETGLGASGAGVAAPLFAFNLGVEIGQVAVIGVLLPILYLFRKKSPLFARHGAIAISAVVAFTGGYWLLQRTVLS